MFASKDTLLTRPSGYSIARSVRLRSSASGYFNRTLTTATNNKIWTWSAWVKRGTLNADSCLFSGGTTAGDANQFNIRFNSPSDTITMSSDVTNWRITSQVFRDPSAWYHFVLAVDTTQATAANRILFYINGVQVTAFSSSTNPTQNTTLGVNTASAHNLARRVTGSDLYFDGYLTEINFIDGQALTPSSFGETDSITGVWKPKAYSGTYGTNGFELNFSDNSNNTAATIGKDYSGNGNNWTPNNISVTAGATYDSMVDSPTVGSLSSNYAVWNVLKSPSTYGTITNGNLTTNANTTYELNAISSISSTTGKFYAEFTVQQANTARPNIGIQAINQYQTYTGANLVSSATTVAWCQDGRVFANGSLVGTFATYTTGDIVCIAVDCDNGAIYYNKNNGAWINSGSPTSGASRTGSLYNWTGGTVDYGFYIDDSFNGNITNANFGQRPFSYTPPTGFVALNTYNLPASTIKNGAAYMAATTYTGNGSTQSITNTVGSTSFQPDFVWAKNRTNAIGNALFDSVRGTGLQIVSNSTGAETNEGSFGVSAFNSNGFNVGSNSSVNQSTASMVAWQWKAGTTSASNTNGSITSTVSVGATQGFSVVTYTGTGTSGQTVGHGLGVKPAFIIVKRRTGTGGWACWHQSLTGGSEQDRYIYLDLTSASGTTSSYWGSGITSSTFGVWATGGDNNASGATLVAYCFSAVAGYSAFGSYTGNGSTDGPFQYLGFRPKYVMIRSTSNLREWFIIDTSRSPYNVANTYLRANTSAAEGTDTMADIVSNGFKMRSSDTAFNGSGETYIYACFAEVPFRSALAR